MRRGAGAVERGGLENRCPPYRGTEGSNPSLSANTLILLRFFHYGLLENDRPPALSGRFATGSPPNLLLVVPEAFSAAEHSGQSGFDRLGVLVGVAEQVGVDAQRDRGVAVPDATADRNHIEAGSDEL
jgi:hypothetical protein